MVVSYFILRDVMAGNHFNGDVYTWLQSGDLKLSIGFLIDPLTALMMPRYRVGWGIAINILGGMAVIYCFGAAGLLIRTDLSWWAAVTSSGGSR